MQYIRLQKPSAAIVCFEHELHKTIAVKHVKT